MNHPFCHQKLAVTYHLEVNMFDIGYTYSQAIKCFFFQLLVDCQLGSWTSCDSCCGSAGKIRFFGRMPKVEHTGDKCSQGDTWKKCENLPQCAGDIDYLMEALF